eukprot:COSAG06_NODE_9237_length_1950_cov_1.399784_2_plen_159_part_00
MRAPNCVPAHLPCSGCGWCVVCVRGVGVAGVCAVQGTTRMIQVCKRATCLQLATASFIPLFCLRPFPGPKQKHRPAAQLPLAPSHYWPPAVLCPPSSNADNNTNRRTPNRDDAAGPLHALAPSGPKSQVVRPLPCHSAAHPPVVRHPHAPSPTVRLPA